MKAKTQYNDITGTSAADISDFQMNSLQKYLADTYYGYDYERYYCEGCRINVNGQITGCPASILFICYDKVENKYVYFYPTSDMEIKDIFSLFKRFDVVLGGSNINEVEIKDTDWLELGRK